MGMVDRDGSKRTSLLISIGRLPENVKFICQKNCSRYESVSLYPKIILPDSPISWWRLGDLSGTTAADSSGNGHAGTYNGTFGLGQAGAIVSDNDASALFDGSTSYISTPIQSLLTTWTVEAWVKPNGNQSQDATVFCDRYPSAVNYTLTFNHDVGGGTNPLKVYTGYYNGAWNLSAGVTVSNLVWSHIVGTYDGTNIRLYVNGTLASTVASASAPTASGLGGRIGRYWDTSTTQYFNGWIDEVALYSGAMSLERIVARSNGGSKDPSKNYRMRSGSNL